MYADKSISENIACFVHSYTKCEEIIDKQADAKMWGQIFSLESGFCGKYCNSELHDLRSVLVKEQTP